MNWSISKRFLALPLLLILVLSCPAPCNTSDGWIIKNNEKHGTWNIALLGSLMPWYIGTGLRFGIPIVPSGFIPTINDEVKIEIGTDIQWWWNPGWGHCYYDCNCPPENINCIQSCYARYCPGRYWRIAFPATLRWEFYLRRWWSVFGATGLLIGYTFNTHYRGDLLGAHGWVWVVLQGGTKIIFTRLLSARVELGTLGITGGIEFNF